MANSSREQASMSLLDIPPELILKIIDPFSVTDLLSLSLVCKPLNALSTPNLYSDIYILARCLPILLETLRVHPGRADLIRGLTCDDHFFPQGVPTLSQDLERAKNLKELMEMSKEVEVIRLVGWGDAPLEDENRSKVWKDWFDVMKDLENLRALGFEVCRLDLMTSIPLPRIRTIMSVYTADISISPSVFPSISHLILSTPYAASPMPVLHELLPSISAFMSHRTIQRLTIYDPISQYLVKYILYVDEETGGTLNRFEFALEAVSNYHPERKRLLDFHGGVKPITFDVHGSLASRQEIARYYEAILDMVNHATGGQDKVEKLQLWLTLSGEPPTENEGEYTAYEEEIREKLKKVAVTVHTKIVRSQPRVGAS